MSSPKKKLTNNVKKLTEKYSLFVVYFINCIINPNYFTWLEGQLKCITKQINKKIAILKEYTIYIIAIIEKNNQYKFMKKIKKLFPKILFKVEFYHQNEYEYRGINKVWEIGQMHKNRNDIILYYHSKGVTRTKIYQGINHGKYNIILKDLDKIFKTFAEFSHIDKIGYSCSKFGWIWYNFWYARGSYINKVEKPIKTNRRHYYEDWLARKVKNINDIICDKERPRSFYKNTPKSCYCFHTNKNLPNIGYYYDPNRQIYLPI